MSTDQVRLTSVVHDPLTRRTRKPKKIGRPPKGVEAMEMAGFRLPKTMVARLRSESCDFEGGKSEIVRLAVQQFFDEMDSRRQP